MLFEVISLSVFFVLGCILLFGARQRWGWLVDPPNDMWIFYSQTFIKKLFGETVLIWYTYVLGVLFMVGSIFLLLRQRGE